MGFDVAEIRGRYTSITNGWTYLNAYECPQLPERVSAALARGMREAALVHVPEPVTAAGAHRRSISRLPTSYSTEFAQSARRAVADLVGVSSAGIVLGPSRIALATRLQQACGLYSLADATGTRGRHSKTKPAHVVVTARGNAVRTPLETGLLEADQVGIAEPDLGTGEIPAWQFTQLVSPATRLVTVDAANPYIGACHDIPRIAATVREQSSALVLVDATAVAPYRAVQVSDFDADILLIDCGKLGGPQVAALAFRDPELLATLDTRYFPADVSPGLLAGVAETIDLHSQMIPQVRGTRRKRLAAGMPQVWEHFAGMAQYLTDSLDSMHALHVFGISGELADLQEEQCDRLPVATFCIPGVPAATILDRLYSQGIVATATPADPVLQAMGLDAHEGAVTVSLAAFNTTQDIDQLLRALASLA